MTLSARLTAAGYKPSGFDYIRLVLASGVILQHTVALSYGQQAALGLLRGPAAALFGMILPMFFALSGFLVAGSLERNQSLISFLGLRAVRLLPALAFEIVLSALVLGAVFTALPLAAYFGDPVFRAYFFNILGWIHYTLPGVFLNNPCPRVVNGQLWTIPAELRCYLALAALGFVGMIGRKSLTTWLAAAIQLGLLILGVRHFSENPDVVQVPILVGCFLLGVCAFRLRDSLSVNGVGAAICGGTSLLFLMLPHCRWLLPLPATYFTVFLGTLNPKRDRWLLSGDYSYGLYLYGFPIQQAVATFAWTHAWWLNFTLAYPLAFGLAVFSWWFVEKPAMRMKRAIYAFERQALRLPLVHWHSRSVFNMTFPEARAGA